MCRTGCPKSAERDPARLRPGHARRPAGRSGEATDLRDTTFVVLDLETTGGAPDGGGITEIGAVKVRGGEELGEFATLVNPGEPIPPFITVLTGITAGDGGSRRRRSRRCCPACWSSCAARCWWPTTRPYDVGFLKAACAAARLPLADAAGARHRRAGPAGADPRRGAQPQARHARRSTSAPRDQPDPPGARRRPGHRRRAARADRAAGQPQGAHARRRDRVRQGGHAGPARASATSPRACRTRPGSTSSAPRDERPLYVGTSVDIATRVRSYFTAAEKRARISEMLAAAERVEAVECAHSLEAEVRELRLIAAHAPPYNRRSKYPGAGGLAQADRRGVPAAVAWCAHWPAPTARLPRAVRARGARPSWPPPRVHDALPLRQCTPRLSTRTHDAGLRAGRAGPVPGALRAPDHARRSTTRGPPRRSGRRPPATRGPVVERAAGPHRRAVRRASATRRRRVVRGRLAALLRAAVRMQRLAALTGIAELVAARRSRRGGWELAVVRHGRLAAAGASPPPHAPARARSTCCAPPPRRSGPGPGRSRAPSAEETERILAWLERPGHPAGGDVRPVGRHPLGAPRASASSCATRAEAAGVDDETRPIAHELTDRSDDASRHLGWVTSAFLSANVRFRRLGGRDDAVASGRPRASDS